MKSYSRVKCHLKATTTLLKVYAQHDPKFINRT